MNFGRRPERALFRPSCEHATPRDVLHFFSEVFAAQVERPRRMDVVIDFSEADLASPMMLDLEKGEPVFRLDGHRAAHGKLGLRWLAEHDAPLELSRRAAHFRLIPTDANRIKMIYYKA